MATVDSASVPIADGASDPVDPVKGAAKSKSKKEKLSNDKSRAPPCHPPYAEMISEAITSLKERSGSSLVAIGKFVQDKHNAHLPENFRKHLSIRLNKLVASGKLVEVKNYKLASAMPKPACDNAAKSKAKPSTKPKAKVAKSTKPASPAEAKTDSKSKSKLVAKPIANSSPWKAKKATTKPAAAPKPKAVAQAKKDATPKAKAKTSPAKAKVTTKLKTSPTKTKATTNPKGTGRPAKSTKTSPKNSPVKMAATAAKKAKTDTKTISKPAAKPKAKSDAKTESKPVAKHKAKLSPGKAKKAVTKPAAAPKPKAVAKDKKDVAPMAKAKASPAKAKVITKLKASPTKTKATANPIGAGRPAKSAKTSLKDSPGKKATPLRKVPGKVVPGDSHQLENLSINTSSTGSDYLCFVDGSWSDMGKGGVGFVVFVDGKICEYGSRKVKAISSSHAEALAILEGLHWLLNNGKQGTVVSDALQVVKAISDSRTPQMLDWSCYREVINACTIIKRNNEEQLQCVFSNRDTNGIKIAHYLANKGRCQEWDYRASYFPIFKDFKDCPL